MLRSKTVRGVSFMDTIDIVEPAEILATAVITDATCPENTNDGAIDLTVSGGTGLTFTYLWSTDATTEDINTLPAGYYGVTITDSMLCTADYSFTVNAKTNVIADGGLDTIVCRNTGFQLHGSPGDSVRWEPAAFFKQSRYPGCCCKHPRTYYSYIIRCLT